MAREYKLISGDSHVNEPPTLWQERVPVAMKSRAPRMERFEMGDAWILEGARDPINFGHNQIASDPCTATSRWVQWEKVRRGGYDATARVKELDEDGVDAELLFPTPRVGNTLFWNNKDRDFHLACIRAYNDWLSQYASHAPERLLGLAMLPTTGAQDAVDEMHRALKLPGIKGMTLGMYPSGGNDPAPEDDALWAACEAERVPVNIHVSLVTEAPADHKRMKVSADFRFMDAPYRVNQFIYSGVWDRFPGLQVVFSEVDCAWVPYVREQLDNNHKRGHKLAGYQPNMLPSEYFERNCSWVFIKDSAGIRIRHEIGVDNMMWSSDHPHSFSHYPHTQEFLAQEMKGVPADERQKLLAGNAMRVYGIGEGSLANAR